MRRKERTGEGREKKIMMLLEGRGEDRRGIRNMGKQNADIDSKAS
jgi:hypothetical protein